LNNIYKEVLTPAEEKFERWRKGVGLVAGPVLFLVLYLSPVGNVTEEVHKLTAVLAFVLVFWLTEAVPLPVTALLGAILNILLGVGAAKAVLAPFAHPLVFLFIGSFILAEAITLHGLDRRFAFAIFSIKSLQKSPLRILFAIGAVSACASMWISNTASTAMMLPIALGVLGAMREIGEKSENGSNGGGSNEFRYGAFFTAMMLMVAYGSSVGGIATPVGSPPNMIGIGMIEELIGTKISFFEWMSFALPIVVVMFIYLFFVLGVITPFGKLDLTGIGEYVASARRELGQWSRAEKNTAFCFAVAVTLWVLPSLVGLALGKEHDLARLLSTRLNSGVVAILAASLLFLLPVSFKRREYTMQWERAVKIDWGTILLFGGGLSLGSLMFSTGLAANLGEFLTSVTGAESLWAITAISVAFAIILSEATSNTASANMVIPVVIATAQGMGVSPMLPAIGACLGASFGFMLPVSTPPNAIVYGSGLVTILQMVKKGIFFDIGGFIIIMVSLMLLRPIMGW
jgi:sodium-dependent dicarboxylate transporter 2/3/5